MAVVVGCGSCGPPTSWRTHFSPRVAKPEAAFGNPRVYLESYVEAARHIEFQVLADEHGATVHLGERECTLQRRHQKVLEETPSIELSDRVRERMGKLVTKAARAVGYVNAGTFEFLMDARGRFLFMEANARLQVEHPITEMVTGVDIVKEQIRIASGEHLSIRQADVRFTGHAIECRVNAEGRGDVRTEPRPDRDLQCAGRTRGSGSIRSRTQVARCRPTTTRCWRRSSCTGGTALRRSFRMRRALEMTVIEGVATTIPLHLRILRDPISSRAV